MNPFVKTEEELTFYTKEELTGHIMWLYRYIEQIKRELRIAKIRV
ncbi:MAG TPA: hypothetical protein VEP90_08895 [Methylomirabilota bacterium]|nr:hypothetical protein [Methylomirabilota bacterium]